MRRFLVAGNWKMNGSRAANAALLDELRSGFRASDGVELLVCPPFPYLAEVTEALAGSGIATGAQNVSARVRRIHGRGRRHDAEGHRL